MTNFVALQSEDPSNNHGTDLSAKSSMNKLLDLQLWNGAWNVSSHLQKLTGILWLK
jgi:hypothetical protein